MKRLIVFAALLVAGSMSHAQNYKIVWDDARTPWRADSEMDAAVQADSKACDAEVGELHGAATPQYKACMARHDWKFGHATRLPATQATSTTVYNRDSPNPGIGWHWENGMRTCHYDCDNPRIPGSGYTCRDIDYMGSPTTECTKSND